MRNVKQLTASQIRIFDPDVIPMRQILTRLGTTSIQSRFGFSSALPDDSNDLTFRAGTLSEEDKVPLVIERLSMNDRRVITQVVGDSAACGRAFSALTELLDALWGASVTSTEPIVFSEESAFTADMEFDPLELLSLQMPQFAASLINKANNPAGESFLKSISLRINIGYAVSQELALKGVSLSDKTFVVEPRMDTPASDRTYFSHSPTDTKTHLELLRSLEKTLKRSQSKR